MLGGLRYWPLCVVIAPFGGCAWDGGSQNESDLRAAVCTPPAADSTAASTPPGPTFGEPCTPPPPPPPPPQPPTIPSSISYGLYRTTTSVPVTWGGSSGNGLTVRYELQERRNGSAWASVYQGAARSAVLSNRTSAVYNYRVRACSDIGCSSYRSGKSLVVSTPPMMDLYAEFPFLRTHDQRNAAYRARVPGLHGEFLYDPASLPPVVAAIPTAQDFQLQEIPGDFALGQGFNLLADAYADICIDTDQPGVQIVTNSTNTTDFDSGLINTTSALYDIMEVSGSAGISFDFDGYFVGLTGDRRRYTESLKDETHQLYVARWSRKAEHWTLALPLNPLRSDFAASMLIPNNANAQAKFRNRCGDKYIYAADVGASLYMVFSYDTKAYSSEERTQRSGQFGIALNEILSGGGAGSVSSQTRALLDQLDVRVSFYKLGGPEIGPVDRSNFEVRVNEFINGTNSSNYQATKHYMRDYDQPNELINYSYFDIFADYRVPLAQMARWNEIDADRQRRCMLLGHYHGSQFEEACDKGKAEIETAKKLCRETVSWSECRHPANYFTFGYDPTNPGPLPAITHLVTWLNANIFGMDEQERSDSGDYHVHGSIFDRECMDIKLSTCLDTGCVVETRRGFDVGAGQGFGYTEYEWDGPGNDSFHVTNVQNVNGQRCVVTTAKICTSHADTTADYAFDQVIYGRCAVPKPFPL